MLLLLTMGLAAIALVLARDIDLMRYAPLIVLTAMMAGSGATRLMIR